MKFGVIITAGGASTRFGANNKLLEIVQNKTVIEHTLQKFLDFDEIIITAKKEIIPVLEKLFDKNVKIIEGGKTRQESVYNGLLSCTCDYVLIHDGARPLISPEIISKVKTTVLEKNAITVAVKTVDTIKKVDENGLILDTLNRNELYNTQTPQAFKTSLIKEVHQKLKGENNTDDAGMVEKSGFRVYVVDGEYQNIKITSKSDLEFVKILLNNH